MKHAFILLSDGFETIEALTPVDIFRRCGIDIKIISITSSHEVISSHNVRITADGILSDKVTAAAVAEGDMIILPGGYPNYLHLCDSEEVGKIANTCYASGKWLAAICAAPMVLDKYDIAAGKKVTCHSCAVETMRRRYEYTGAEVQQDGNLITARGAGISLPFALRLASLLAPAETVDKIKHSLELF